MNHIWNRDSLQKQIELDDAFICTLGLGDNGYEIPIGHRTANIFSAVQL